jgi:predicted transcriptional regulator
MLAWVATGRSNQEIANESFLSPATVRTHISRAMGKLGARDRVEIATGVGDDPLEAVAQVNGVTVAEEVRKAIQARIAALRADPDFQARLRDHLERNREILEGLAST